MTPAARGRAWVATTLAILAILGALILIVRAADAWEEVDHSLDRHTSPAPRQTLQATMYSITFECNATRIVARR